MKRRATKIVLIIAVFLVIVTNAFPIFSAWRWYYFTTKNGEFYFDMFEAKGRDFAMMNRWWDDYRAERNPTDTTIYRTFSINPFAFWEWRQYLFSDKYRYPYINPKDIEKGPLKESLLTK
jgi:hypothetical protein